MGYDKVFSQENETDGVRDIVAAVEKQEFLLSFFSALPDNTVLVDSRLQVVQCSKTVLDFLGFANEEACSRFLKDDVAVFQKVGTAHKVKFAEVAKGAFEQGFYEVEWTVADKNENTYIVEANIISVHFGVAEDEPYLVLFLHGVGGAVSQPKMDDFFAETLKAIVNTTPLALNVWDSKMNNLVCNKQALRIFGLENESEFLSNFQKFSPQYQPNGILSDEMFKENMEIAKREGVHCFKWLHLDNEGQELPAEVTLSKMELTKGEEHIVSFVRDLRPEFERDAQDDEDDYYFHNRLPEKTLLSKMSEISDDMFFVIDRRTNTIRFLGKSAQKSPQGQYRKSVAEAGYAVGHVHEDDRDTYQELVQNMAAGISKTYTLRFLQPDGSYRYHRVIYRFLHDKNGRPIIVIGKGVDVHEQMMLEQQYKFDFLTKCFSKVNIEAMIAERLSAGKCENCGLVFVDVDNFKTYNEQSGHYHGDEVLRQLAARIKKWSAEADIVGRIGGDEFIVYVANIQSKEQFGKRLDDLLFQLNESYSIYDTNANIGVSAGVALYKDSIISYEQCISRADKALFMAKLSEENRWLYYEDSYEDDAASVLKKKNKAEKISGLNMDYSVTSTIFNILYERNNEKAAINAALQYLGQYYNAGRCFIVESFDNGANYHFTYEWCSHGLAAHMQGQNTFSKELLSVLIDSVARNGVFACEDIATCCLQGELFSCIAESGTKSFLHAQIKKDNVVSFFIGVEDCKKTRKWADVEINTLHYMARVFSVVLQGKYLHEEVKILSEYSKVSAFIGDNTDNFIYIVDPDTYDILHMNKKALMMYNNPSEEVWRNKKCYDLLHEKSEPCEFCTNCNVTENEFYEWSYYNPRFNKTYLFKDKLVHLGGKLVKFQVATDITKIVSLEEELKNKLIEQSLLLNCIKMLHTGGTPDDSIVEILNFVCTFFEASRGVILQISPDGRMVNNTHEWTNGNVESGKHRLQNLPIDILQAFFERLRTKDVMYITDIQEEFKHESEILNIMYSRKVSSFSCAPILDTSGNFIGMFALDNPAKNIDKYWLLASLSGFISDFLEKNRLIYSLEQLSYYDSLTKVKNRHSYRQALQEIDEGNVSSLGVAYIDITGLARINEEKGTRYGDEVIKRMSRLLSGIFDEDVFRVGGDEFVVLEKNVDELEFEGKINNLRNVIMEDGEIKASIGFTWNTDIGEPLHDNTDEYNTVRDSRNYTAILSKNLDNEIKCGKYHVYLQPQINFETGKLDGAEALIRRLDASGNVQSPASFVPFYEKEGMISQIDFYVFETLCRLISSWRKRGMDIKIKFSVNCSRSTIMGKNMVNRLCAICEKYNISKSMFVVEITETISHTDDKMFSYVISSLKSAGFCVSLDDFGTGHSNLVSLQVSDFDEIKIDMGLTKAIHVEDKSKILTKVALNLCQEFKNMVSVAEGIETKEQFDILKKLNCQKGQGYYFSKPICIEEFEQKYLEQTQ